MPEAVPVTFGEYEETLRPGLQELGYYIMTDAERTTVLAQMHNDGVVMVPRYPPRGGEEGFMLDGGDLIAVVWTSCLRRLLRMCRMQKQRMPPGQLPLFEGNETIVSRPTSEDVAWLLILQKRRDGRYKAAYFARTVLRTKGFSKNLVARAKIVAYNVMFPAKCDECGNEMKICENKKTGGNFWGCFSPSHGGRLVSKRWHSNLPPELKKPAEQWDREAAKQRRKRDKELLAQGKPKSERAHHIRARANAKRMMKAALKTKDAA